jgi:dihydroorotase
MKSSIVISGARSSAGASGSAVPPEAASDYRDRILAALPEGADFEPLMTLYLTEGTTPGMIDAARSSGFIHGVKLYPAGATTNAASGVTDIRRCYPVFEAMQRVDLPLLIHGEVVDSEVDIFDREAVFIERHLEPLIRDFPGLRVVLEHVTTEAAVRFVQEGPSRLAATITPQHLLYNRNALFAGGMRPHHFCLPILKRERHRKALVEAATSGHPRFFLGTDSAPHPRHAKESACGCAGIYSAHAALELYAEAFAAADALDRLEGFASHFGPDFYGLARNTDTITLERSPWTVPDAVLFGHDPGVPLRAGETIGWQLT